MAVAQGFEAQREPVGKRITARIALPDDPGGDITGRRPQKQPALPSASPPSLTICRGAGRYRGELSGEQSRWARCRRAGWRRWLAAPRATPTSPRTPPVPVCRAGRSLAALAAPWQNRLGEYHQATAIRRFGDGVSELDQQPCYCGLHDHSHAVVACCPACLVTGERGEPVRGRPADQSAGGHLSHPQPRNPAVRVTQHLKAGLEQARAHPGNEFSRGARHAGRLPTRRAIMPPNCTGAFRTAGRTRWPPDEGNRRVSHRVARPLHADGSRPANREGSRPGVSGGVVPSAGHAWRCECRLPARRR